MTIGTTNFGATDPKKNKASHKLSTDPTSVYPVDLNPLEITNSDLEPTRVQEVLPEPTKVYPAGLVESINKGIKAQTQEIVLYEPSASQEPTQVKNIGKLKIPKSPDITGIPSGIPTEMLESTSIQVLDQDILISTPPPLPPLKATFKIIQETESDPDSDITFLHPRDVHLEEVSSVPAQPPSSAPQNINIPTNTSEEATNPGISPQAITKRKADLLADFTTPEITFSELPAESINEFDLQDSSTLTLDQFIQKKSLFGSDINSLYWLLRSNFNNLRLWTFISNMAKDPYDVAILKKNMRILSPKLLDSLLIIGATRHNYQDNETGFTRQILLYHGSELDRGSTGQVDHIYFVYDDSLDLREALLKQPMNEKTMLQAFMIEIFVANKLKSLILKNQNDPRVKNILLPEFASPSFLVIPKIANELGETITLNKTHLSPKFSENGQYSVQKFCQSLAGAVGGLDFLSENGIIVSDNKPANIVDSANGGVIIDIGGFVDLSLHKDKYLKVYIDENKAYLPAYNDPQNSEVRPSVPITDSYGNAHLLGSEILGDLPNDITHKYTTAKILEKLFCTLKLSPSEDFSETAKKPSLERLKVPAIELTSETLENPIILKMYQLYKKLFYSFLHPYQYIENNPANGLDPEYISLKQAQEALQDISTNSPQNV